MAQTVHHILVIRMLHPMVKAILTQELRVTALGFEDGVESRSISEQITLLPANVKFIPMDFQSDGKISGSIHFLSSLKKLLRQDPPQIVHVNALQDLVLAFIAVRSAGLGKDRPQIIAMAHNPSIWGSPIKARLAALIIRLFSDGFVSLATTHKNQLLQFGIPPEKLVVIPNSYDPAVLEKQNNSKDGTQKGLGPNFLYVAAICPRKGQHVLVQAASEVLKKYPEAQFEFLGKPLEGEEEYAEGICSLSKQLNIQDHLHFAGSVPFHDVMQRLACCNVFVFPSLAEMMPRAVIEAMIAGKPVIASGVDGILDLIQDHKTGLLVQSKNENELARAMCELIENPVLASSIGLAGQRFVMDFCSPQRVGQLFKEFYQSRNN